MQQNLFIKSITSLFRDRRVYICFGISLILIWTGFSLFIQKDPKILFPAGKGIQLYPYNDETDGGSSVIKDIRINESEVSLSYIINKGFISPYVGVTFADYEGNIDIRGYDHIHLEIEANGPDNLFVYLITKDSNVKDSTHRLSLRHSQAPLNLEEGRNVYSIPLDDFSTPKWWFEAVNQSTRDFGPEQLDKLKGVSLTTGISPVSGKLQEFTVKGIYFYKDYTLLKIMAVGIELIIIFLFWFFHFIRLRKEKRTVNVRYLPTEDPKKPLDAETGFYDFIQSNYFEPDLTLKTVARKTGVSERLISKSIAEKYGSNFKTYLNRIRIEEARRLLNSTALNISEVAYKVGFNSPSTFTRVFKKFTGKSPSDYTGKNNIYN